MALSAVENLQHQARNASQEDIDKLCKNILDIFHVTEKTSDCLGYLRSLFFILQASDEEPCLPQELLVAMVTAVGATWDRQNTRQCSLCQQIISELLPSKDSISLFDETKPVNKNYLPICLIQGHRSRCLEKSFNTAVRWVSSQGFDFDSQKKAFSFLVSVVMLHKDVVAEDCVRDTSNQVSKWLMNASLQQAPNPYTMNPFRKDKTNTVTEIDGTPSRNFFTLLNIGRYYTEDQFLNIYSFSLVYKWLYYAQQALTDSGDSSSSQVSMVMHVFETLVTKTIDYCFRVFDQCERKPKVPSDSELQTACLSEAVTILDLVCRIDAGQVPHVHQEVKRLFTRISQNTALSTVNLQILQFFLNHSATVVHDPGEAYEMFFNNVLTQHFQDPGLAFDVVRFTLNNLETLCYKTDILSKFFPNFLKLLAWHPSTFLSEFVEMLPAFMSPTTSMEVFHSLLDLPCMTAALEIVERVRKTESQISAITSSLGDVEPSSSALAFQNPLYRPLFNFVTRAEGGHGDTINRLSALHQVLQDMKTSPRVRVCGQTVTSLLGVWFSVILDEAGDEFASRLLPVLLERSGLLYDIPDIDYQQDVTRLLSENLALLLNKYPVVVSSQYTEITDFIMSSRNITERESIFSNLAWAVGEFCSMQFHAECTADLIAQYYGILEAVIYEVSANLTSATSQERISPKIMSVLMSAVSKLATRCQDLIPRAILCLTKVAKQHMNNSMDEEGAAALVSRAQELINLLKLPNFASLVLNPSPDIDTGRWHRDNTSLPVILHRTHRLLCPNEI